MLIDSNVLIYAINADSPKHKLAKQFLEENIQNLQIAHQNILETLRVLTHTKYTNPLKLKDALKSILAITKESQIICPTDSTYYITVELIKEHDLTGNRIFDAYLAATAASNDINTIATDNVRDFAKFKILKVVNPFVKISNREKKES